MIELAQGLAREAGALLLERFGAPQPAVQKDDLSNVVTEVDRQSERLIVQGVRGRYPGHSLIAEESGCALRASEYTWIVDPLDGTSNFAAGIPWFGVLIAVCRGTRPIAAVLHTPATGDLYAAEAGSGAFRNGQRISVTAEAALGNVLWAVGMDGGGGEADCLRHAVLLARLLRRVRNVRATNSLMDPAYTADGRLGGMLNHSTRIWDIAAPMLIVQEAGGLYTRPDGAPLSLNLSTSAAQQAYAVLAGAPALHADVVTLLAATP